MAAKKEEKSRGPIDTEINMTNVVNNVDANDNAALKR